MTLRWVRLILIALLLLNGISAASAIPLDAAYRASLDRNQDLPIEASGMNHMSAGHADCDPLVLTANPPPPHGDRQFDSCCDDASCGCGCILMSALLNPAACVLPHVLAPEPRGRTTSTFVVARSAAPFRPPAQ